jgi:hypothetical protein
MKRLPVAKESGIHVIIGATRSGKTFDAVAIVGSVDRLLVWSPKESLDNHAERFCAERFNDLKRLRAYFEGKRAGRAVFVPSALVGVEAQFNAFCAVALNLRPMALLIEEIHTVVTASHCPAYFRVMTNMGAGGHVGSAQYPLVVTSQRAVELSKNVLGNASKIIIHRCGFADDAVGADKIHGVRGLTRTLKGYDSVVVDLVECNHKILRGGGGSNGNEKTKSGASKIKKSSGDVAKV